jgi:ribose-phosphate pyrophosphokinase
MRSELKVFSGNSNFPLAEAISRHLGVSAGRALVTRFSDGELRVDLQENVRGRDVYVIQSTCRPVNDNLVELLVMIDALKRSSAARINAVIPYYGYARRDLKRKPRVPLSAKLVADLLSSAGAERIVSLDLHSGQVEGFFKIPVESLSGVLVLLENARGRIQGDEVIVAPDANGVRRSRAFAADLDLQLAILDYRGLRYGGRYDLVGDVRGRRVIILDDIVDTGRTIQQVVWAAEASGAKSVEAFCVHPVLSPRTLERLEKLPLRALTVTDSIPLDERAREWDKMRVVSVAPMLAEVIRRIHSEESVTARFMMP